MVLLGGSDAHSTCLRSVEMYDFATRKWARLPPMLCAREGCSAVRLVYEGEEVIVVVGGNDDHTCLNSAELYHKGQWTMLPDMMLRRSFGAAVSIGDSQLLVMGGLDGSSYLSSTELFDLNTQEWTQTADMRHKRSRLAAVSLLDDSHVVAVGGHDRTRSHDVVELYSVAKNAWMDMPHMRTQRTECCAVAYENNTVFVLGGNDGNGNSCLASVERLTLQTTLPIPPTLPPPPTLRLIDKDSNRHGAADPSTSNSIVATATAGTTFTRSNSATVGQMNDPTHALLLLQQQQNRLLDLERWMDRVFAAKCEYRNQVQSASQRLTNHYNHLQGQMEMEIQTLKEEIAMIESHKKEKLTELQKSATFWMDGVAESLGHAQRQIDELRASIHASTNGRSGPMYLGSNTNGKLGDATAKDRKANGNINTIHGDNGDDNSQESKVPKPPPRITRMNSSSIPPELYCPITLELMFDPVLAADGHTYERSAIDGVFARLSPNEPARSPKTGQVLPFDILVPNVAIRSMCREYQQATEAAASATASAASENTPTVSSSSSSSSSS